MPAEEQLPSTDSSLDLLRRAQGGDPSALGRVFARLVPSLQRWAHRRLPAWARDEMDTADVVQEALIHVLRRLPSFEARHKMALRAYLRQSIRNRIRDEIRRVSAHGVPKSLSEIEVQAPRPQGQGDAHDDYEAYQQALGQLELGDRELIVARLEIGYSYEQLALALRRPSPDAARMAFKRALIRLLDAMKGA